MVSYPAALQRGVEKGLEINNVAILCKRKRNCVVIYNSNNKEDFPPIQKKKQHNSETIVDIDTRLLSNDTVTTWRNELNENLNETSNHL